MGINSMKFSIGALSLSALALMGLPAEAKTICTVVANAADGKVLLQEGDCKSRVTPASTFKIPLSLMGYDSGFLTNAHAPTLPFRKGYADWGGDAWKQPTDPARWMTYSVVWFSQQITKDLGLKRLENYARSFDYGNADFSGDPGKNNALERAWISSSLKISPLEQIAFLGKLVNGKLPVSGHALEVTRQIVESRALENGWTVSGKTGAAFPRQADNSFDYARGSGWYVGWATKGGETLVFARLTQDENKHSTTPGIRTRDGFVADWPGIEAGLKR